MREFNSPEMKIASFDKEAVVVTVSSFTQTVDEWVADGTDRQSVEIDYENMPNVLFNF